MTRLKVSGSMSHLDTLSLAINNPSCFYIIHAFRSPSPAETPGNHHCEWRGDGGRCSDPGGLHAPLLSDPLHCGPSLPLPDLWAPHRLPCVHWPGGQSITELNLTNNPSEKVKLFPKKFPVRLELPSKTFLILETGVLLISRYVTLSNAS